jgi:PPP family 3-phenylpropionic acid transporter
VSAEPNEPSIFTSPAARVSLVLSCLCGVTGVTLVFLPRWLEVERGLSGVEIGAVLSLAQLARIVTGPSIAFWADGAADRRTPLRWVAVVSVIAFVAFFSAHGFWPLLILGFIAISTTQVFMPLIEAMTLRATAEGNISYGIARGIGSLTFIIANIGGGLVVSRFGLEAVVVWVLSALVLMALSSWFALKPDLAPIEDVRHGARLDALKRLMRSRRFLTIIVACGLIQAGHAFYYGFSTLVWRGQGLSPETVGVLWGFGVAVEVAFLWSLPAIERRVSPEAMILLGAAGAVVRWFFLGFAPTGGVLWPLQAMHMLSFAAVHVGAMRLIYREAPPAAAAMAQTLYSALSSGLLIGAATLLSGALYDVGGAKGYWAMTAIAAAGGALALTLLQPAPRRPSTSA